MPEEVVRCLILVLLCNAGLSGLEGHSSLHLQQRGEGRNALVQWLVCSTLFFEVTSKPFPSYQVRIFGGLSRCEHAGLSWGRGQEESRLLNCSFNGVS